MPQLLQCRILNPLPWARDRTHVASETQSWILNLLCHSRNSLSNIFFFFLIGFGGLCKLALTFSWRSDYEFVLDLLIFKGFLMFPDGVLIPVLEKQLVICLLQSFLVLEASTEGLIVLIPGRCFSWATDKVFYVVFKVLRFIFLKMCVSFLGRMPHF